MRVFLTEASGYLGQHVAEALQRRGDNVLALAHSDRASQAARQRGFEPVVGSLASPERLAPALANVDAILHLAASDDPAFNAVNRTAIASMLGAMPAGAAFVMQGGSLVFGPHPHPEPDPDFAPPPFLETRAALERDFLGTALAHRGRRSVVYGGFVHGGTGGAFPTTLARALRDLGRVPYPGDGRSVWSTVHVADWASLVLLAADRPEKASGKIFAASGAASVSELAAALGRAFEVAAKPVSDQEAAELLGPIGAVLAMPSRHSDANAVSLGWRPRHPGPESSFVSLAQAVRHVGQAE